MDDHQRSRPGPREPPRRPIQVGVVFAVALLFGVVAAFLLSPSIEVALSAAVSWLAFLVFGVAAWDWLAMVIGFDGYLAWLPKHGLPAWFTQLRSSFVVVVFLYGIILSHFWWR